MTLELRPWTVLDDASLLEIFTSSDDLGRQSPAPVTTLAEASACRRTMLAWRPWPDQSERYAFAIVADGAPVGNLAVSAVSRGHDTAWISYFSSAAARGRGYVRRSLLAVSHWCFEDLGLFRLELGHRVNNPASGAVAEAAGFVPEGIERAKLRYGEQRFDTRTLSLLATDPRPSERLGEEPVSIRLC